MIDQGIYSRIRERLNLCCYSIVFKFTFYIQYMLWTHKYIIRIKWQKSNPDRNDKNSSVQQITESGDIDNVSKDDISDDSGDEEKSSVSLTSSQKSKSMDDQAAGDIPVVVKSFSGGETKIKLMLGNGKPVDPTVKLNLQTEEDSNTFDDHDNNQQPDTSNTSKASQNDSDDTLETDGFDEVMTSWEALMMNNCEIFFTFQEVFRKFTVYYVWCLFTPIILSLKWQ